jgi:hypothetical protein
MSSASLLHSNHCTRKSSIIPRNNEEESRIFVNLVSRD